MIKKFISEGCSTCRKIGLLLDKLQVPYENFNISEDDSLIEKFNLRKVPTLINENNERLEGVVSLEELKSFCNVK